jgi:hypothetical protein
MLYMFDLCEYKDIFGKPRQGAHSFRIFNVAVIDVFFTILAAFIVSYFANTNIYYTIIGMFVLGVISHRLFCVRTTIDKLLFY